MGKVVSSSDILQTLLEDANRSGIISTSSYSFIPEIAIQADNVTKEIFNELEWNGIKGLSLNTITLGWSAYAGLGTVKFWNDDWENLKNKGIVKTLISSCGIDKMDEFVLSTIGLDLNSGKGKKLNDFFLEKSQAMAFNMIKEFMHEGENLKAVEQFLNNRKAMYLLGMRIEMDMLGLK